MTPRNTGKEPAHSTSGHLRWWGLLIVCTLTLGTLIILAIKTSMPLVLIAEAISVVLLAATALIKALRD